MSCCFDVLVFFWGGLLFCLFCLGFEVDGSHWFNGILWFSCEMEVRRSGKTAIWGEEIHEEHLVYIQTQSSCLESKLRCLRKPSKKATHVAADCAPKSQLFFFSIRSLSYQAQSLLDLFCGPQEGETLPQCPTQNCGQVGPRLVSIAHVSWPNEKKHHLAKLKISVGS